MKTLPEDMGDVLPNLVKLNCAHNDLTTLPRSLARMPHLRIVFMLKCKFTQVPTVCGEMASLYMLSFKANR